MLSNGVLVLQIDLLFKLTKLFDLCILLEIKEIKADALASAESVAFGRFHRRFKWPNARVLTETCIRPPSPINEKL
jgi:hypothetical protein